MEVEIEPIRVDAKLDIVETEAESKLENRWRTKYKLSGYYAQTRL
jgi:hypothetical protein